MVTYRPVVRSLSPTTVTSTTTAPSTPAILVISAVTSIAEAGQHAPLSHSVCTVEFRRHISVNFYHHWWFIAIFRNIATVSTVISVWHCPAWVLLGRDYNRRPNSTQLRCGQSTHFEMFCSRDKDLLMKAFCTYVRPLLEYSTPVWSPHYQYLIFKIENVQRANTKRLAGMKNLNYLERLKALGISSLERRRIERDLILCTVYFMVFVRSVFHLN